MLVLSRKRNEEIVIAGEIRVRVLELRSGRVRLGISAPPEVTVDRAEVVPQNCFADCGETGSAVREHPAAHSISLRAG